MKTGLATKGLTALAWMSLLFCQGVSAQGYGPPSPYNTPRPPHNPFATPRPTYPYGKVPLQPPQIYREPSRSPFPNGSSGMRDYTPEEMAAMERLLNEPSLKQEKPEAPKVIPGIGVALVNWGRGPYMASGKDAWYTMNVTFKVRNATSQFLDVVVEFKQYFRGRVLTEGTFRAPSVKPNSTQTFKGNVTAKGVFVFCDNVVLQPVSATPSKSAR